MLLVNGTLVVEIILHCLIKEKNGQGDKLLFRNCLCMEKYRLITSQGSSFIYLSSLVILRNSFILM